MKRNSYIKEKALGKDKRDIIYIVIDKGDKKNERFNKHKTI